MDNSVARGLLWLAAIPLAAWSVMLVLAPRLRYAGVGIDDMGFALLAVAGLLACLVVPLVAWLATQQGRSLKAAIAWAIAAGAVTVALACATVVYAIVNNWAE